MNHSNETARELARFAHFHRFDRRRGFLAINEPGVVAIYDNNPFADAEFCRHELLEALKTAVTDSDISFLGEAAYPESGPADGYTVVLLFQVDDWYSVNEAEDTIHDEWMRILLTKTPNGGR